MEMIIAVAPFFLRVIAEAIIILLIFQNQDKNKALEKRIAKLEKRRRIGF